MLAPDVRIKFPSDHTNYVIHEICKAHDVSVREALSPTRQRSCFLARQDIARYLRACGMSLTQIGVKINRDHTTVLNALEGTKASKRRAAMREAKKDGRSRPQDSHPQFSPAHAAEAATAHVA